jgi:hypothetical protein
MQQSEAAMRGKKARQNRKRGASRHEFSALPEFDQAMRKIVGTPKDTVTRREASSRKPRTKR